MQVVNTAIVKRLQKEISYLFSPFLKIGAGSRQNNPQQ